MSLTLIFVPQMKAFCTSDVMNDDSEIGSGSSSARRRSSGLLALPEGIGKSAVHMSF